MGFSSRSRLYLNLILTTTFLVQDRCLNEGDSVQVITLFENYLWMKIYLKLTMQSSEGAYTIVKTEIWIKIFTACFYVKYSVLALTIVFWEVNVMRFSCINSGIQLYILIYDMINVPQWMLSVSFLCLISRNCRIWRYLYSRTRDNDLRFALFVCLSSLQQLLS